MIKFFRKFRQTLLAQNKLGQYLLYALGEIILVVIGILIALQINNWSEERKAQILELEMIQEVKAGLEEDLKDVKSNLNDYEKRIIHQNILIAWLESDRPYYDSLTFYFASIYSFSIFAGNEGPYETLKQYGLRRIRNDSLRNQIAKIYDIVYPGYVTISKIYEDEVNELKKLNYKHFRELGFENNAMRPLDTEKLKSDNAYMYQLKTLRNYSHLLCLSNSSVIEEIEKTIRIINQNPEK